MCGKPLEVSVSKWQPSPILHASIFNIKKQISDFDRMEYSFEKKEIEEQNTCFTQYEPLKN